EGDAEHVLELPAARVHELAVEGVADPVADALQRVEEPLRLALDADVVPHGRPERRLEVLEVERRVRVRLLEGVVDRLGVRDRLLPAEREAGLETGAPPEDEALEERVRPEPVRAVERRAGAL